MARPSYKPTVSQRRRVSIAAGAGMAHEEIALGMGISRNTLLKYFASELTTGAYKNRLEVFEAMYKAAKNGNVAAQKAYAAMAPRAAAPASPIGDDRPEGKKARAQAAAVTAQAGTEWETLLKPGQVQ